MSKDEHIAYWLEGAAHDLETAESLFQSPKYDWCLFPGHYFTKIKEFYQWLKSQIA